MDFRGHFRTCADTGHFNILEVLAEIVNDCLKGRLVAQVTLAKVPEEADFHSFH